MLLGGVPLFLCLPPWNDVTLHDMAARAILRGGVHYRDVFDTNLPGIDWAMAVIRACFGWGYEVLRAVDLLVIGAAVAALCGWVTGAQRAWFVAAAAMFYPFTSEFSHVQRDPWMFLPAVVAARLRVRQIQTPRDDRPWAFRGGVGEGFVWGVAVWLKPHVLVPALAVWVTSVLFLKRQRQSVRRDFFALLAGGIFAGLPGVAWLVGTGAWPYFVDVFTNWNPDYVADGLASMPDRVSLVADCFRPWSLLNLAAIPLAVAWLWSRTDAPRCTLAALYLGFVVQGVVVQKGFDYVHVAETLMAMAVVAAAGWSVGFGYLVWFLACGALLAVPALGPLVKLVDPASPALKIERHRLLNSDVMRLWPRCWREGSSAALRDQLAVYTDVHVGTGWEDLDRVAAFLRSVDPPLRDRELTCWHDSTHPLYLMLNLEPSTRYMHFGTAFDIRKQAARIAAEVAASPQRYVVSDLRRMTWDGKQPLEPGAGGHPLRLPAWFPVSERDKYPWNQPVVYRAGRYVVHKMSVPPGVIDIPAWTTLDKLGPGE